MVYCSSIMLCNLRHSFVTSVACPNCRQHVHLGLRAASWAHFPASTELVLQCSARRLCNMVHDCVTVLTCSDCRQHVHHGLGQALPLAQCAL